MQRSFQASFLLLTLALAAFNVKAQTSHSTENQRWEGSYMGISAGVQNLKGSLTGTNAPSGFPDLGAGESTKLKGDGQSIGVTLGSDWVKSNTVYGIFGDIFYQNAKAEGFSRYGYANSDSTSCALGTCRSNDDDYFKVKNPLLLTLGGRVGQSFGSWMAYAGAGLSAGKITASVLDDDSDSNGGFNTNSTGSGSASKWAYGYTLKLGADFIFTQNTTLGLSYSTTALNSRVHKLAGKSVSHSGTVTDDVNYKVKSHNFKSDNLMINLNYRFK
jgi:opacity protein-like surface antigen